MALFNFWGCFSESSPESSRYVCNGDICVLRDPNTTLKKKKTARQSFRIPFTQLSLRKTY
nr:autophagy protein ATG8d [Ipomoea batatas]GMC72447.1 autophagy protein ATG8d [Ipomoea batatas]GMC75496.1 autophagy protein ATG8d [Ipomoea batatas]GMC76450.1 autophagy protein ATG8d [Ipomoea batatas]